MKFISNFILLVFCSIRISAQQLNSYVNEGIAYVNYSVEKSEGFNAIALKFSLANDVLLRANNVKASTVLQQGQIIKIPISTIIKPACGGIDCFPVYYEVQQSEGLYRIGKNHGDIKPSQLKQLNKLNSEVVSKGQKLLVGYIKANLDILEQEIKEVPVVISTSNKELTKTSKDSANNLQPLPLTTEPVEKINSKSRTPKKDPSDTLKLSYNGEGFFQPDYLPGGTQETMVIAAPFKSESGWTDGKFYILVDSIQTGKIVKITNPLTSVFIYAKTLGGLPQVKGNNTIRLRLSNAAAVALGYRFEEHFEVKLQH